MNVTMAVVLLASALLATATLLAVRLAHVPRMRWLAFPLVTLAAGAHLVGGLLTPVGVAVLASGILVGWQTATVAAAAFLILVGSSLLSLGLGLPTRRGRPDPNGPQFRLVSSNVLYVNRSGRRLAEQLLAEEPDVLVLLEYDGRCRDDMDGMLEAQFPHCIAVDNPDPEVPGVTVLSRLPVVGWWAAVVEGRPALVVDVQVGEQLVTVVGVHTRSPVSAPRIGTWLNEFETLESVVNARQGPAVLAGDFNATAGHAPFRALLRRGRLTDLSAGLMTWTRFARVPYFLPLDHVLGRDMTARRPVRVLRAVGSDHAALVADLMVCDA